MAKRTILIVDDDHGLRSMMTKLLERNGYQPVTASNGQRAIEQYHDTKPDLILLDVAMPGMSGFEVAAQIRAEEGDARHTPIVILTAYAQSYFVSRELKADIDGYITKPVVPQKLIEHLESLIPEQ